MVLTDEIKKEINYVKNSKYRLRVMKSLVGEVKIPKEIAAETGITPNHVSKTLVEMKKHDLVECLNPEMRKGRLYRQTNMGKIVCKNIKID